MENSNKKILVTGGSGFVGTYFIERATKKGYHVTNVSRNPRKQHEISWDEVSSRIPDYHAVVHLAGENVFSGRWTKERKQRILSSRVDTTKKLVDAMMKSARKPAVFLSASAVGFYGDCRDEIVDESVRSGDDFLAQVCVAWENAAKPVESIGVRLAHPRIGIVLEKDGGALEKMLLPFQLFAGGPIGSGNQYMPWIHVHDLCEMLIFAIENNVQGPFNAVGPDPVKMSEFAEILGKVLNRPSWFPAPEFALKIALGESADAVLTSCRAVPKLIQNTGFEFAYEDLESALKAIL